VTRCDEIEPLLGELALGVLADDRRSAVLDHVGFCLGCRALLLELAATADALLQACPPAEPSPGFDTAVLAGIGASRRRRRSPRSVVAALVEAVLLVAAGLVVGVGLGHHHREELRTAPLVAPAEGGVGDAVAYAGPPTWVFMRVDRALPDGTYRCVVTADGGPPVAAGSLVVIGGQGSWGQRIGGDAEDLRTARLETADGTVVATASFR